MHVSTQNFNALMNTAGCQCRILMQDFNAFSFCGGAADLAVFGFNLVLCQSECVLCYQSINLMN